MSDSQPTVVGEQVLAYKLPVTAIRLPLEAQQRNSVLLDTGPQFTERRLRLRRIQQRPEPCAATWITLTERIPVVPGIPESGQMQVLHTDRGERIRELSLGHTRLAGQWRQTNVDQYVHACIG